MTSISQYKKRREIAVFGIEATPGTAATKQYMYRWLTKGLKSVPSILENESAVGSDVKINDSAIDVWHSEGPLGGKVTENGVAILLHGMLNKVTTTTATPTGYYKHALVRDKTVARKSLSFWDVRPGSTRLYKSMYMDNLNFKIEASDKGAWLEADTALKGWRHTDVTAITPALDTTEAEFTSRHVIVLLADNVAGFASATNVKARSITLALEEGVSVDHSTGEINDDPEFDFAPQEAKGTMVIKYRKTDFEDDYFINKIHALKILVQNGNSIIEIIGTKVRFREVTNSDGRDDTVTQTISFYFEADDTNGGKDITANVTNTLASLTT